MKLGNKHIFKTVRIIKKAGIKNLVISVMQNQANEDSEAIGIDMFNILIDLFDSEEIEQLIYELLADIAEKTAEEISIMPIEETKSLFEEIAGANNLKNFFDSVSAILKKT